MITVLRLGHRHVRDHRISTHCGLVARAFGADEIIFSGERDDKLMESIDKVARNFGGDFKTRYERNWRRIITEFTGVKVHLTMYGLPLESELEGIKNKIKSVPRDMLVIIGGQKVPGEVYQLADYNIAIGNQPHSEVAALAVFLNVLQPVPDFSGGKKIIPQKRGKKLV
ncbi:MAG: tRNA (cytidine(56)-2'-O)-methyltransferase [DPANN group archaeon]|nr:tRNA (cytidine(56)-2'-O)-methyltransferase [DPANN group archaeon]